MSQPHSSRAGEASISRPTVANSVRTAAPLEIESFASWDGTNELGEFTGAGAFANGDGAATTRGRRFEYDDGGWFLTNVRQDCSAYTHLELIVRSDDGGEASELYLEIDSAAGRLSDLTADSIGTDQTAVHVDLRELDIDRSHLRDIWLSCWDAGSGAVELEAIRLVDHSQETIEVGEYDTQDTTDDGLHNDFTGDGETGFDDVSAFADNLDDEAVQNNPGAFDFAGNDRIGFADVLELLRRI